MSTSEEIMDVYEADIGRMTDMVVNRQGLVALCKGMNCVGIEETWPEEFEDVCEGIRRADFLEFGNDPASFEAKRGSL